MHAGTNTCTHACSPSSLLFVYPHLFWPDYTTGGCYVISRKTVGKILVAQPIVHMIPFEDVYFTGLAAGMFLNTRRTSIPGCLSYDGRMEFDVKQYATKLIASHNHGIHEIERWWTGVTVYRKLYHIL